MINYTPPASDIIELKEKLEIAVNALKKYSNISNWEYDEKTPSRFDRWTEDNQGWEFADEALKKINGDI